MSDAVVPTEDVVDDPRWPLIRHTVLFVAAVITSVWLVRGLARDLNDLFIIVLVSLFLSFAIEPAVNALARRGWRRGTATAVVMLGVLLALVGFFVVMATLVVGQVRTLIDDAPRYLERSVNWINDSFNTKLSADDLAQRIKDANLTSSLASQTLSITTKALTGLLNALTIGLFTFYFVADGPKLRRAVCSILRPDRQREVLRVWEVAVDKTGGYLSSRALLAMLSATFHAVALTAIGVPSAIALGVWVGIVSQFLPVIGTYLAGVLPVVIALVNSPTKAVIVFVFVVVYQQIENYLFAPRITARTMNIHPAIAFGSVLAGASVLGTAGALLALPGAASIQAVVSTYLTRHEVVDSHLIEDRRRRRRKRTVRP